MKNTELVRHIVREELDKHPEIEDTSTARSVSTKIADPRLDRVDFSPEPLRLFAEIVADSVTSVDWDQTGITDEEQISEELLLSILQTYKQQKPTERDSEEKDQEDDGDDQDTDQPPEEEDYLEGGSENIGLGGREATGSISGG